MTLSRCSAYETHDKLLFKILSSIIHSKNKLGERIGCAVHIKKNLLLALKSVKFVLNSVLLFWLRYVHTRWSKGFTGRQNQPVST